MESPQMKEIMRKNPDFQLTVLGVLPMYHMAGQMILSSLIRGRKVVTLARFIPQTFLAAIEKYKVR